jgi:hypothetical protein
MKPRYDSYCGIYCGACPILVANVKGVVKEKAAAWEMKAKDIVCRGCKSTTLAVYCKDCVMRLCARDRDLDFCVECEDYPCNSFETFQRDRFPHHTLIAPNLAAICAAGVDAWLEGQKKRWSCPKCGEPFTWYEEECAKCGGKLYDACAEEDDWAEDQAREGADDAAYWKIRKQLRRFL